jgi:hypothetical protein
LKKAKHILKLNGFDFENGKIPFSVLNRLSTHLIKMAEETLLLYVEGLSRIKRGKHPDWLEKSLDFSWCGIKKGSTVLEVEAPFLKDTLDNAQIPIYQDPKLESIENDTAISLSMFAFERAISGDKDTPLLDKYLLNTMHGFKRFLKDKKCSIDILFQPKNKILNISDDNLSSIKKIEEKTPERMKVRVTGKLDLMKHSSSLLEIITSNRKIRAILSKNISFSDVKEFFGEDITITGMANYNPFGNMTSIELLNVKKSTQNDDYFRRIQQPLSLEFDLKQKIKEKNYKGFDKVKFDKLINEMAVEEPIEELLNILSR